MDETDRRIVNALQERGAFPVSERPYAEAARALGLEEDELIGRLGRMCADGTLSRFGPLFDAERLGGAVTLAAMAVPEGRFEAVADMVNAYPEVAHNYARDHALNMWFVVSAADPDRIGRVIEAITAEAGLRVYRMPKLAEYFIGLRLAV